MAVVIWDPNWFPPEEMDDVERMRRVYLNPVASVVSQITSDDARVVKPVHEIQIQFLPNEIWRRDFYATYPITDDLSFKIEGKLYKRQLLYGKYTKNDKKYVALVQNTTEGSWATQIGLLIFGEFVKLEDWQDLKDDFIAGNDVKDLLKHRTILKFPP